MRLNAYAAVSAWNAQANVSSLVQKRQESVNHLFSSLQSKDLLGAQKAFSEVAKNSPVLTPTSPMAQIGLALSKGQLEEASKMAQTISSYKNNYANFTSQDSPQPSSISSAAPSSVSVNPASNWSNPNGQGQGSTRLAQLFGQGSQVDLYV